MKQTLRTRLVKVIEGQGQVKFHLAPIGLKLGENEHGCDVSTKGTLRMRSVKVIQGQGQVRFLLAPIGPTLGDKKLGRDRSMKQTIRTRLVKVIEESRTGQISTCSDWAQTW